MPTLVRLIAEAVGDQRTVDFFAEFPVPAADATPDCRAASLFATMDTAGQPGIKVTDLLLCAPTAVTWHTDRRVALGRYTYPATGPYSALLRWGEATATVPITLGTPTALKPTPLPTVTALTASAGADPATQAVVRVTVNNLAANQRLRIDAGAGQVFVVVGTEGTAQQKEWPVTYSKSGEYVITADVLDSDGYWLGSVGQTLAKIAAAGEPTKPTPTQPKAPAQPTAALPEVAAPDAANVPWLPHSYVRPLWGGVRTYSQPGGGAVIRSLVLGTYLAIQRDTVAGGQVWHQSVQGDWVASSTVAQMTPSNLRGVELQGSTPPPPPPGVRYGVVTATTLNVRSQPSTSAPIVGQLANGAQVTIYEERTVSGAVWYRIGTDRWVHSAYVRITQVVAAQTPRYGIVTADVLNVRTQPDVSAPLTGQVTRGMQVTISGEQTTSGALWYSIGDNRWVHSHWISLTTAEVAQQVAPISVAAATLPVGWVVASSLNVRAQPGVSAGNPPIDEVLHNYRVDILESRTVNGAIWYRIGQNRWVLGTWIAVASLKARPSGIGSAERWVGVNLAQQTAVAYQGNTPVYAAMIASGMAATPTVQGVFRTWARIPSGKMSGGSTATGGYYYLEGVTWTCYFYSGYALHTAYWHDAFGRPRSHGCVNLSPYDAWWIYQWSAAGGANSPAVYVYAR